MNIDFDFMCDVLILVYGYSEDIRECSYYKVLWEYKTREGLQISVPEISN